MLRDYLEERGISVYKLSKDIDVSYSTINDIVIEKTDIKNASANLLYRLSKYLNISMERLYEDSNNKRTIIYLRNEGRNVILQFANNRIQYLGPKNLLFFRRINKFEDNVIYVECYFEDLNGFIYTEEDYIDLSDILKDFDDILFGNVQVIIGKPSDSAREKLINKSLLVSDNIAILYYMSSGVQDKCVQAVSLARPASYAIIRLKDCAIVSSNMGEALQRRALEAVNRNIEDVLEEVEEVEKYA